MALPTLSTLPWPSRDAGDSSPLTELETCGHCGRPFFWERRWATQWDDLLYCWDGDLPHAPGGEA
jgi:hypothetical protein